MIISACTGTTNSPSTPTTQSVVPTFLDMPTLAAIPTSAATATQIPTPLIVDPSTPPAWVADFAEPILERAADQYATFQDDFTAQLNHGWFYIIANNHKKPYFAHLEADELILKIPDGLERKDAMVYSPKLARKNFVLSFDFKFGKTEPADIFRFQFQQTEDQSMIVDLSKNETSSINWHLYNDWQSVAGVYDHFGPALVNIIIMMNDHECAVYINHDPFAYLSQCRADPILKPIHESVLSFHLLSTTGRPATVAIDNVKFWDLDKIP